jgi:hypothetical protein
MRGGWVPQARGVKPGVEVDVGGVPVTVLVGLGNVPVTVFVAVAGVPDTVNVTVIVVVPVPGVLVTLAVAGALVFVGGTCVAVAVGRGVLLGGKVSVGSAAAV